MGPEKKVVGGWDFVGDKWDGSNDPVPDNGMGGKPIDTFPC